MIPLIRFLVGFACVTGAFKSSAASHDKLMIYASCENREHGVRTQYVCDVHGLHVDAPDYAVVNAEVSHLPGKDQSDVQGIYIENLFARYLPSRFEDLFWNMTSYRVVNSKLEFLGNFNFYKKLKSLNLDNNLIREVPKRIFSETTDMEWLSMDDNRIEDLADGLLDNMPMLRLVSFSGNRIRRLSGSLFANNRNIERLNFNGNRLTTIGADLVRGLSKLRSVNFDTNICINEAMFNESEMIEKLTTQFTNFCSGQCESNANKQMNIIRDQNRQMLQQREAFKAERENFCLRRQKLAMSSSE